MVTLKGLDFPDTLNIFCDASINKFTTETLGCPGSIAVCNLQETIIVDERIRLLRNSTNNNSEITAILMAVEQAIYLCSEDEDINIINIFSDSKISVYGLREWIFNWARNIKDGLMYSSSGTPVSNQQIFVHIIDLIVSNNLNVNLYHQKGHVTSSNLDVAKRVFLESNGIELTDWQARYISNYNDYIDKATKNRLVEIGSHYNKLPILQSPIIYSVSSDRLQQYQSLINRN